MQVAQSIPLNLSENGEAKAPCLSPTTDERRQVFTRVASGLEAERATVRQRLHEIEVRKDLTAQERKQAAALSDAEAKRSHAQRQQAARDEDAKKREVRCAIEWTWKHICRRNVLRARPPTWNKTRSSNW